MCKFKHVKQTVILLFLQVEMSWILLFRQLVKKRNTTERMTRRPRYE